MNRHGLMLALLLLSSSAAVAAATGLLSDVVFSQYSELAGSDELARRLLSPVQARRIQQHTSPVSLAQERFALYVPSKQPPNGYALLVFVPPWEQAEVPHNWTPVLERHGFILVTAAHSGNDADAFDRRAALAVLGAVNVMASYRVDPRRVYVGGFSGGSRIAMRVALGYPDLFHGALLDAGSDPVGDAIAPPPEPLLEQFQTGSRLVYLTGQQDSAHLDRDRQSRRSLAQWCISDVQVIGMPWVGHELAEPSAFERALVALEQHRPPDTAKLQTCRAHLQRPVD
jgi:predicted esterase